MFPSDSVWNTPIDTLPVDVNSAAYVATIGTAKFLHPDFSAVGGGIPFVVVPGTQPKVPIMFGAGAAESDPGPYPIPANAPIEGGPNSAGDRHVLVVENTNCILYEMYSAYPQSGGSWIASSGAVFDLKSNRLRPAGWTSADAAGLPILPGLVRYEEVMSGVINHAIRMTAPKTRREYIWPARHRASSLTGIQYPPMGQRFRLKASFDITSYPADVRVILTALKKYGAILADNGSSWYLTGVPDTRWNDDSLHKFHLVLGSNMEAVDESSLMVDPNSGAAFSGAASLHVIELNPPSVSAGATTTANKVILTAPAPASGITVSLSSSNLALASVPATVLVPPGAATALFTIHAGTVAAATPVTITAFYAGVSKTATLTIYPVAVSSVTISPVSVAGGVNSSGNVTLSVAAPASGATVILASSNTLAAKVPASVTIPAGATSGAFTITTFPQVAVSTSQITASYGGTSASAALSVLPPVLTSVVISPATIQGGTLTNGYVYISSKASAPGLVVSLTSSDPSLVAVPATVTISPGASVKYLTISTPAVVSRRTATISATANGVTKSAVLIVNPATLLGFSLSSTSVTGGATVTGTILLGGLAGGGGTVVTVSSSVPATAGVPASVTVPAGTKTVAFPISTTAVSGSTGVTITIRSGTAVLSSKLTVNP